MATKFQQLLQLSKLSWTTHAKMKMAFYGLSESRVRRVMKTPLRTEEGIAEKTAACMQPASYKFKNGEKTWNQEIWVMFSVAHPKSIKTNPSVKIISAWRYPGKTKPRTALPDEILAEIDEGINAAA